MTGRLDRSGAIFPLLPLRATSGHGSAKGFADRDRITPYLQSLLLLRIEMSDEAIGADQNGSGADLNEDAGDDL